MQGCTGGYFPVKRYHSRWPIPQKICLLPGKQEYEVEVQISLRISVKQELKLMVQLLAQLYTDRRQTQSLIRKLDSPNPSRMEMVLQSTRR
jgi:hypothetical protein